jgi:SAM-dependent methyltransferase
LSSWKRRRESRESLLASAGSFVASKRDGASPVAYHVDWFWCDPSGMYFKGWIHCHGKLIKSLAIRIGDDETIVDGFHDRPDVPPFFPDVEVPNACGFEAYVPSIPGKPVLFNIETAEGRFFAPLEIPRRELPPPPTTSPLYGQFIDMVNEQKLTVLELGSRIVGTMTVDNRQIFHGAGRYIGMDIHPSPTVDIVGDVHELSSLVGAASLDAIYSISVFEHLERPWIVAEEMNRALRPGGVVFHSTVHSWPIHEYPNDFWRFSDEGLKVLFGPAFGFEVIGALMTNQVSMYPQYRFAALLHLPMNPGYAESCILSRKIAEIPAHAQRNATDLSDRAREYPLR